MHLNYVSFVFCGNFIALSPILIARNTHKHTVGVYLYDWNQSVNGNNVEQKRTEGVMEKWNAKEI